MIFENLNFLESKFSREFHFEDLTKIRGNSPFPSLHCCYKCIQPPRCNTKVHKKCSWE